MGSEVSYKALSSKSHAVAAPIANDSSRLIAFYLPQFHRVRENSEWWGPGFTEWTNVAGGRPNFQGHYQPHIPRELGFYDLTNVEVIREQARLAQDYGIHGFCFYYYWFSGRRILEKPLDAFLHSDIELPFCICWANENWTRTWAGDESQVLLKQGYNDGDQERFFEAVLPIIKDRRYIRIDGKPLLVVYRATKIPDVAAWIAAWRKAALANGVGEIHVGVVDFYDVSSPAGLGADSLIEFPPHKYNTGANAGDVPEFDNPDFAGSVVDYRRVIAQSVARPPPDFVLYRGIMPGWDNTARRQNTPTIVIQNTPERYAAWLTYLRSYNRVVHGDEHRAPIFVNAWNEWGEGCHLEPDLKWGLSYLDETARTGWVVKSEPPSSLNEARKVLMDALNATERPERKWEALPGYTPQSEFVRVLSERLRAWPLLHKMVRAVYRRVTNRG